MRTGHNATLLRWCEAPLGGDFARAPGASRRGGDRGRARRPVGARTALRYVGLAERARDERPEQWGPYHEATLGIAKMTARVEHDLGAAIEHGPPGGRGREGGSRRGGRAGACEPRLAALPGGRRDGARALSRGGARAPGGHGPSARVRLRTRHARADRERDGETRRRPRRTARRAVDGGGGRGHRRDASGGVAHVALAAALAAQGAARRGRARGAARRGASAHIPSRKPPTSSRSSCSRRIRARRGRHTRATADLVVVRRGLARFTDAGRLPALADAVEALIGSASTTPADGVPSAAELSVLQLSPPTSRSGRSATRLFLSVNTVKTHTRSLYRKLGRHLARGGGGRARSRSACSNWPVDLTIHPGDHGARRPPEPRGGVRVVE